MRQIQIQTECYSQFKSSDSLTYRLTELRKTSNNLIFGLRAPNWLGIH